MHLHHCSSLRLLEESCRWLVGGRFRVKTDARLQVLTFNLINMICNFPIIYYVV